jgi:hypothetical protein
MSRVPHRPDSRGERQHHGPVVVEGAGHTPWPMWGWTHWTARRTGWGSVIAPPGARSGVNAEALAVPVRPGNAGAKSMADHVAVLGRPPLTGPRDRLASG